MKTGRTCRMGMRRAINFNMISYNVGKMERGIVFFVLLLALVSVFSIAEPTSGPLRVSPDNPRYFQDSQGHIVYLSGSHVWYNIHYNDNNPQMTDAEFDEFLDWMQEHNYTYTRLWTGWGNNYPSPWLQPGPGTISSGLHSGEPKADMTRYNQDYFDMVRDRVQKLQDRGIYCSVMFFGSLMAMSTDGWSNMLWNPDNNINPELADAFSTTDGHTFFTDDPDALAIQEQFVKKMVDTLNDLDNVIWEVGNEGNLPAGYEWQYEIIDYVKAYEQTKPKQHPVGMTSDGISNSNSWILNSPADWISPDQLNNGDNYMQGGPASYDDKVVINDVDHLWGHFSTDPSDIETGRTWVWKTFTRGNNPILMDCYTARLFNSWTYDCPGTLETDYDPIRDAMGYTARYSRKLDLANTYPSDDGNICSTTYCLMNQGKQYLIYQPGSGSFTADVAYGDYDYEWFNPRTNKVVGSGTMTVSSHAFSPPFSGDAVLYLNKASQTPTYSCTGTMPSNAAAYDTEESTGLTADTAWAYSTTDTAEKCEFHCDPGFSWDGSSCKIEPQADPVAYWSLEEGSGSVAHDSSGKGNDGTLMNGPAWISGKIGAHALGLDGIDDYVSTSELYRNPQDFTLSLWFKTSTGTGGKLIGFGDAKTGTSVDYDRHIYMDDSGVVYFGTWPGYVVTIDSGASYNDGKWHQVAATLDSSAGMALFIDGVEVSSSGSADAQDYDGYWRIGYDTLDGWPNISSSYRFQGSIDDVKIWNRALSAQEIRALHDEGAGTTCNTPADSDNDGQITISELIDYIGEWKSGEVSMASLIDAIGKWKSECSIAG